MSRKTRGPSKKKLKESADGNDFSDSNNHVRFLSKEKMKP